VESALFDIDDDLIDLERVVVHLRNVNTDTAEAESSLASLSRRSASLRDNSLSKLSKLLAAVSRAVECEQEHEAVVKWMKEAENQLRALDDHRSLSEGDKHRRLEVQQFARLIA